MSIKKHSEKKRIGSFGAVLQNVFHEKQQQETKKEADLLEQVIQRKQAIQREQAIRRELTQAIRREQEAIKHEQAQAIRLEQEAIKREQTIKDEQAIKKEIEEQSELYQYAFDEIKNDFEKSVISLLNSQ